MKIIECEQRGADWFNARIGRPTASSFCEIVAPSGKAKTGVAPRKYMLSLLGERLTRQPARGFSTDAMQRGIDLEAQARAWYELTTGYSVRQVGFVLADGGRWGCSPDGLCEGHGVEIKCPMLPTFLDIAESREIPDDHFMQIQGSLWITGLPRWDYVVWTDARGLVPTLIGVEPDAKVFAALDAAMPAFCDALDAAESKLREAGHGWTEPESDDVEETKQEE